MRSVGGDRRFALIDGHRIRHVLSSANPLFSSAAEVFGSRVIAVVLTGCVDRVLPLEEIAPALVRLVTSPTGTR